MKPIILLLALLCIAWPPSYAQWTEIETGTNRDISDIHFVDSQNGFMSCSFGEILKSTNGGADWQAFDTGFMVSFFSIFGIDKDTVYTARRSLYKSTNSCESWEDYGGLGEWGAAILDMNFITPKTGFIIKSGKLYKTYDSGHNWDEVYDHVYSNGNIIFPGRDTGYVVGGGEQVYGPNDNDEYYYESFGSVIKTTDGGENWEKLEYFGDTMNIVGASFLDNNFGYAITSNNFIHKTENGGLTWTSVNTGITGNLRGVTFVNRDFGFIAEYHGEIYVTNDGGLNWTKEYTASDQLYVIGKSGTNIVAGGNSGLVCFRSIDDTNVFADIKKINPLDVSIFPNPAREGIFLQIQNGDKIGTCTLSLRNVHGQEVLTNNAVLLDNRYSLDISKLERGIYFLTLLHDNERIVKKVIIQE